MEELVILAAVLDKLPADPQARMGYDLFADGLYWSDEIPQWDWRGLEAGQFPVGHGLLRALLHHRSAVIQGAPAERFADLWDKASKLCPNWPGFLPSRRDPGLADEYRRRAEASSRSWEEADARFEKQRKDRTDRAIA